MADKKYKVYISIDHMIVYTAEVVACSEDQAREFAYDMFERDSAALIDGIDVNKKN